MQSLQPKECYTRELNPLSSPLIHVKLPSEAHAKFLSQRGILVKGVYEIWGHGETYDDVITSLSKYPNLNTYLSDASLSWKINVDAFGLKLTMDEQIERRERFRDALPFAGPVELKDPTLTFLILEDIGVDEAKATPHHIYFLRALAGGEKNRGRGGARDLVNSLHANRIYMVYSRKLIG
jgi:tRNA (guanine10-N2)-methyltransferase